MQIKATMKYHLTKVTITSVQFSHSVVSDSLQPHGLQHTRLPCASSTPGACSNSSPSSLWCHPTISSSVPLFLLPQSFPASGSFLMNQLFTSGVQSIGASASASVLPKHIQGLFPSRLAIWSLCCSWDSQECSPAPQFGSINSLTLRKRTSLVFLVYRGHLFAQMVGSFRKVSMLSFFSCVSLGRFFFLEQRIQGSHLFYGGKVVLWNHRGSLGWARIPQGGDPEGLVLYI